MRSPRANPPRPPSSKAELSRLRVCGLLNEFNFHDTRVVFRKCTRSSACRSSACPIGQDKNTRREPAFSEKSERDDAAALREFSKPVSFLREIGNGMQPVCDARYTR